MPDASAFSPDYIAARARFRAGALARRAHLEHHPLDALGPDGEDLSIDYARIGSSDASRIVLVTSGLHGIEGYFGSAVQAAVLEEALGDWVPPEDAALVFIHALNPWGMAWKRRVNEDNVDLNRNFLLPDEPWRGLPEGYAELDRLLHPRTPPGTFDPFLPKALWLGLRRGGPLLRATAAAGQYDRPRGLFFGGNGPSPTSVLLREQLRRWFGPARDVLHLDLHTGVGARGRLLLLTRHAPDDPEMNQLAASFGRDLLVPWLPDGPKVRGEFIPWLDHHLDVERYEGLVAEVGTVGPVRLLTALRAENRAHHHGEPEAPATEAARERLATVLNPMDPRWRKRSVLVGVRLVQRALEVHLGAVRGARASA